MAAGIASFFSPCSFPLLLSVLARAPTGAGKGGTGRALGYAATLAAGAAGFLLLRAARHAQQRATTALANSGSTVKRWDGWIPPLVGAWFLILAVFARTFAGLYPV